MVNPENNNENPAKVIAVKQRDGTTAPIVTAKAEGHLAERLLDLAFSKGVKIRQDKDLTELLSALDIESPVPLEALDTISLILERVYAENERLKEMQAINENGNNLT